MLIGTFAWLIEAKVLKLVVVVDAKGSWICNENGTGLDYLLNLEEHSKYIQSAYRDITLAIRLKDVVRRKEIIRIADLYANSEIDYEQYEEMKETINDRFK